VQHERAWHAVVKEANTICARYPQEELVIRPALPRNRADYVGAMEIALERERAIQAELAKLQPPPNYKLLYSQFLDNRQVAIAELKHLQRATKDENREEYVLAARELALRTSLADPYAPAGMPACVS
jgi:hypothetical protein